MDKIPTSVLQEIDERKQSGLPIGYRFHPTDLELLDYLLARLKGEKLPLDVIMDLDVYQYDPHQLPLDQFKYARENEAHFFTREQRRNLLGFDASIRPTPSGCWKVHEENIPIYNANEIVGFKNTLFFYTGNNPSGNKTDWEMVEYRYDPNMIPVSSTKTVGMEGYIVCRVRLEDRIEEEECLVEELLEEESGINEGSF